MHALNAGGARVSFAEIVTDKGHDAFLLEEPELFAIVAGFLEGAARRAGLRDVMLLSAQARSDHGGGCSQARRRARRLLRSPRWWLPAPRCWTWAAATASCCGCLVRLVASMAAG